MRVVLMLTAAAALAACDGQREQAGEKADNAAGVVNGEDSIQSGPAETIGERQDQAKDAAEDAKEAHADALEDQADALEEQADQARRRK
jgi:hypothetical protein